MNKAIISVMLATALVACGKKEDSPTATHHFNQYDSRVVLAISSNQVMMSGIALKSALRACNTEVEATKSVDGPACKSIDAIGDTFTADAAALKEWTPEIVTMQKEVLEEIETLASNVNRIFTGGAK